MSEHLIVRDFSFLRDFRSINWKKTLWYGSLRAFGAGILWGVFMFFVGLSQADLLVAAGMLLLYPVVWPIAFYIFFLPVGIVGSIFSGIPGVGFILAIFSLIAVSVGDPIVCLIKKLKPNLVPVENPPLFDFTLIFWVCDEALEVAVEDFD